jgi:hypothetical protein
METFVELPAELKMLLGMFVTVIVTQFLKWLGDKLGVDLSGYAAKATAALVGAALVLINAVLSNIPAEFAPIVNQLFALAVVVLGAFGAYKVFLQDRRPL